MYSNGYHFQRAKEQIIRLLTGLPRIPEAIWASKHQVEKCKREVILVYGPPGLSHGLEKWGRA